MTCATTDCDWRPAPSVVLPIDGSVLSCPCDGGCKGQLAFKGRNRADTLVFLECTECHCGYVAVDAQQVKS